MHRTDVVVIGGGQAGLAMSRCLGDRAIAHVVLERGRIAESWRSHTWDSLRLLTPNWMARLPGWRYRGADPNGFMTREALIRYLDDYAASFRAPLEAGAAVRSVEFAHGRYRIATDRGTWEAPVVVIATGHSAAPQVPMMARGLSPRIHHVTPARYKRADDLPPGGVLVVGASASGIQLADEIHASGRPVTIAVGRHTRLPRRYRGQDIMWWLDRIGVLTERADAVRDLDAARRQPSLQLIGHPDGRALDLTTLQAAGVRITGRAVDMCGTRVHFADDLMQTVAESERRMTRVLARIDNVIALHNLGADEVPPLPRIALAGTRTELDLAQEGISTVVWATGYRRGLPWLKVPVRDMTGEIRHRGGVTPAPGLYLLGWRFMRRRNSSFIDGVGRDARELADEIALRLHARRHMAA
ncbi:MAG: pyridine nucleotide-disulfide oxidoreductase [Bradyrhizobiaceae bacterium]|nr:MAG: pyridine nucleotide-disulfide oxidoreductase [Bradyrhizobiaceae bacterium]